MRDDQQVVVRLRPTATQALAHGLCLGGAAGMALGAPAIVVAAVMAESSARRAHPDLTAFDMVTAAIGVVAAFALVGASVGGLVGLVVWRERGVDIDDVGVRPVPYAPGSLIPWRYVVDLHTERRGGRIVAVMRLRSGECVILRAPYTGRLLAADAEFERKLFVLRNRWETHRSFNIYPE
jgi:hypothetical protein